MKKNINTEIAKKLFSLEKKLKAKLEYSNVVYIFKETSIETSYLINYKKGVLIDLKHLMTLADHFGIEYDIMDFVNADSKEIYQEKQIKSLRGEK